MVLRHASFHRRVRLHSLLLINAFHPIIIHSSLTFLCSLFVLFTDHRGGVATLASEFGRSYQ